MFPSVVFLLVVASLANAYSSTGSQAAVWVYRSTNYCDAEQADNPKQYAEQKCLATFLPFVVDGVQYNYFNMDCDDTGAGVVTLRKACGSGVSAVRSVPVCSETVVGQPESSYLFQCIPVADNTKAPTTGKPTAKATPAPTPYLCRPSKGTTKRLCTEKLDQCANLKAPMKWGAAACINKAGNPAGDGGCQCKGYCGYTCKTRCQVDKECAWKNGKCINRATQQPEPARLTCL